jgi:hypothetical protein
MAFSLGVGKVGSSATWVRIAVVMDGNSCS